MVLSGYTDVASITDAVNKGAVYRFLTKPWEDNMLRAEIAEAFQTPRGQDRLTVPASAT
jgi:FixJ family two-component response regulator